MLAEVRDRTCLGNVLPSPAWRISLVTPMVLMLEYAEDQWYEYTYLVICFSQYRLRCRQASDNVGR